MSSDALEINWEQEGSVDLTSLVTRKPVDLSASTSPAIYLQPKNDQGQRCKLTLQLQQAVDEIQIISNARSCELFTISESGKATYCSSVTGRESGDRYILSLKTLVRNISIKVSLHAFMLMGNF